MQEHPSNQPSGSVPDSWKSQADQDLPSPFDAGSSESAPPLELLSGWDGRRNTHIGNDLPVSTLPGNLFSGEAFSADLSSQMVRDAGSQGPGTACPSRPGSCLWIESIAERNAPVVDTEQAASGLFSSVPSSLPVALPEISPEFADSLGSLLHDARNLVTTLDLYCDLLDTPGVLEPPSHHYAGELRLIANGSHRILEKLMARAAREDGDSPESSLLMESAPDCLAAVETAGADFPGGQDWPKNGSRNSLGNRPAALSPADQDVRRLYQDRGLILRAASAHRSASVDPNTTGALQRISSTVDSLASGPRWRPFVAAPPIQNLAEEVLANHNLLCALAGPGITVGLSLYDGKRPVPISADDLTRILVNLVKNAGEAMPEGGHIQVALEEFADHLSLSVSDTGVGIPESSLESIFTAGFTSRVDVSENLPHREGWPAPHRGMGLAIVRSIMAAAGGSVTAANRRDGPIALLRQAGEGALRDVSPLPVTGAVLRLRFPIRS